MFVYNVDTFFCLFALYDRTQFDLMCLSYDKKKKTSIYGKKMISSTLLLSLTALAIGLIYVIGNLYRHLTYWQSQNLPTYPGIAIQWMRKPFSEFTFSNYQRYGKMYGAYSPFNKILVVNDARMVRDLSTKAIHQFPVRNNVFHQGTTNITRSLFFMEANEDWKRIRSIVTPAFTSGKLRRMASPIDRIAHNFVEHIRPHAQSGDIFDLKKYIGGFAMDVIASCGYGIEIDSVRTPNHPIVVNAKKILNVDASLSFIICFMFPRLAALLDLEPFNKKSVSYFDKLTFEIVEKRMEHQQQQQQMADDNNNIKKQQNSDFLGLMMEEAEKSDSTNGTIGSGKLKGITKDEISGQGILFFIAGFDTTHATFDHTIYYMTQHPEWQDRLYEELYAHRDTFGDYDSYKTLPILNAIINETLRLNPPLTFVQRETKEDCELLDTGIRCPKGTAVIFEPYVIHRLEENFSDPHSFKPERFLNDSAETNPAFMPFGAGHRLCVGMRFAQNELRIGLSKFFLNYRVEAEKGLKLQYFRGSILMSPKNLMVRISER